MLYSLKNDKMVKSNCKVDFIPFTEPTAKLIDTHFWVIATLEPVTLHVSCLNKNYYLQLKFPLDIG